MTMVQLLAQFSAVNMIPRHRKGTRKRESFRNQQNQTFREFYDFYQHV